jgi:hypothetical protein
MVRKGQAKASYMDESDSDSDFIPEARPPAKKKAKAARTSTQDPVPVADTAGIGSFLHLYLLSTCVGRQENIDSKVCLVNVHR